MSLVTEVMMKSGKYSERSHLTLKYTSSQES